MIEITTEAKLAQAEQNGVPGGFPPHKRSGSKRLMPGSWVSRAVRCEYCDGDGREQTLSGNLLDLYPAGPIVGATRFPNAAFVVRR